jgi:DNA-cytosine methyltransferase
MNILSLFDGISAGMVALERAGIEVTDYYASEVDKYAIQVSQENYPKIIRLGDVTKWEEWDLPEIDLVIGGSPCQGFSFAGKQLNFNDPRSALFFEFVNILRHVKPKYFLLENVVMKQEYQDVISEALGVQPIMINSALVSAQNRKRLYWTNIPNVTQPDDRGISLKDELETGFVDRDKSFRIDANYFKGGNLKSYFEKNRRQLVFKNKSNTILATIYKENAKSMVTRSKLGLVVCEPEDSIMYFRKLTPIECERLQTFPDTYTKSVSNSQRYKMLGNSWTVDVIAHIFGGLK